MSTNFSILFSKKTQSKGYKLNFKFIFLCLLTTSCAHRINITPPLTQFKSTESSRVEKNVAYFISPKNLKKQVVTPGGGDKVKYLPYKESEPALRTILSNIFNNVYPISTLNDTQFIISKDISYIFIPNIDTNSSSRSIWIWPPSDFTVTLNCYAMDSSEITVWQTKINAEAHLGLPSVFKDHSLAGKVAIEKAFSILQREIHAEFSENQDIEYNSPIDSFDEGDDYYSPQDFYDLDTGND